MIKIYPIQSILATKANTVDKDSMELIQEIENLLKEKLIFVSKVEDLVDSSLSLILIQSGGSEGFFKKDIFPKFNGPYYLLTYGANNSLAASLEVLSFIKNEGRKGEVLHGDVSYIVKRIKDLMEFKEEKCHRLGVFGIPSDWLISSNVDYKKCLNVFNIELIDVAQEEIIEAIKSHEETAPYQDFHATYPKTEMDKAYNIYLGLKDIVLKYNLEGFTLRCFDILSSIKSSSCLALAMFNDEGIIGSCEGDIPALLTMFILKNKFNSLSFQANPNWIDPIKNELTFAHCTLPLTMAREYSFDTHFESGIGIGIHGKLKEGPITICKISSNLELFYVEEGEILRNEYRKDRCRTQVVLSLYGDVSYFLNSSLGNHHIIIYGHKKEEIKKYLISLGLRRVI